MGLLDTIKSLLGLNGSRAERRREGSSVTVERDTRDDEERPVPDVESEAAVKEPVEEAADEEAGADEAEPAGTGTPEETDDEPVAAGTDAAASTGSMIEDASVDEPDERAEPAEAVAVVDAESDDAEAAEPGEAAGPDAEAVSAADEAIEEAETDEDEADGEPVEAVRGIGPAYGERLAGVGVTTVEQLAAADAAELAGEIDVSQSRVSRWIDRARERTE